MDKRFDSNSYEQLVSLVEQMTGKKVKDSRERALLTRGADEIDLVRSGLEETMITSYEEIREIWKRRKNIKDLRTAAFTLAIQKIGSDYISLGIFP